MAVSHSIDDVVRTSDEAAVRMHFDERTLAALRILSLAFLVVSVPFLIFGMAERELLRIALAAGSFLLAGIVVTGLRGKAFPQIGDLVRGRARAAAIVFALAQSALLLVFNAPTEGVVALSALIPLGLISYRLLPGEHVLLHAALAGISILTITTLVPAKGSTAGMVMPPLIINAMAMTISLAVSRRVRRVITAQWAERRASAREQIRMRDELRLAREVQLSMLPDCAPRLDWADVCSISIPATEVGGDYYDYFVEDDRIALVCGDVAGHGMSAGLVLAALRSGFTLMRESLHDPAAVLRRLHDLVAQTSRRRMLVTVAVVLVDYRTGRAIVASAGHPPVILRRPDGSVETIDLFAPPLGVRLPVAIPQRTLAVGPGSVFVLHSDGIYETEGAGGTTYGLDRLSHLVATRGDGTAEELRNAIVDDVAAFRGAADPADDVTVVVCRLT